MPKRTMKSRLLSGVVLGTAAFALAACKDESVPTTFLESSFDCSQGDIPLGMSQGECEAARMEAEMQHEQTAPRYDAIAVCEEQHGAGQCVADDSASGGSIFMPLLAGYMIGNMMNNGAGYKSRPLVSAPNGQFATTDGRTKVAGLNRTVSVRESVVNARSAVTAGKAPMSRATVSSRGGFGAARGASFGG